MSITSTASLEASDQNRGAVERDIDRIARLQERAERCMLNALMRHPRRIAEVMKEIEDVRIPTAMHRASMDAFNCIVIIAEEMPPESWAEIDRTGDGLNYLDVHRMLGEFELTRDPDDTIRALFLSDPGTRDAASWARKVAHHAAERRRLGMHVWPEALYQWFDVDDTLLYIGISSNLATRQATHARKSSWAQFAARATIERFPDRESVETMERNAILSRKPLFNHIYNDTSEARERLVAYLVDKERTDLLMPAISRG